MPLTTALSILSGGPMFGTQMSALCRLERMGAVNGYGDIPGKHGRQRYVLLGPKTIIR